MNMFCTWIGQLPKYFRQDHDKDHNQRKTVMATKNQALSKVLPTAPLLMTESKDEFTRICDALNNEIRPRGIIEALALSGKRCGYGAAKSQ